VKKFRYIRQNKFLISKFNFSLFFLKKKLLLNKLILVGEIILTQIVSKPHSFFCLRTIMILGYVFYLLVCHEDLGRDEKDFIEEQVKNYPLPSNIYWKDIIRDLKKKFGKLRSENKVKNFYYSSPSGKARVKERKTLTEKNVSDATKMIEQNISDATRMIEQNVSGPNRMSVS
jgi:hypothetical protein